MTRPNGPLVRELRQGNGWTRAELARRIRRTPQAIGKAERGNPVSETLMRQVARALKVKLADITLPEPAEPAAPGESREEARDGDLADVA